MKKKVFKNFSEIKFEKIVHYVRAFEFKNSNPNTLRLNIFWMPCQYYLQYYVCTNNPFDMRNEDCSINYKVNSIYIQQFEPSTETRINKIKITFVYKKVADYMEIKPAQILR